MARSPPISSRTCGRGAKPVLYVLGFVGVLLLVGLAMIAYEFWRGDEPGHSRKYEK